ncbi:Winged helix DNA-binding domain-containing protein [Catalinimonas alkaloidigena]|uniref:Winged helix DNA-binding domain-containing protein n=1 Tax=Catalinimonas alkaloidigena TaxID=1075417 RepID=A0A1G9PAS6_9BACT|nr:transcriptional regulator [Catalinimonas alkaloidigena]SDL95601.1 Winged helix DNA-binding domain-containing protein [Catalinimonas alkaloidigena]
MKNILSDLDKAFENRVRLGAMSVLMVNDWVEFTALKETLEVTDGNLASHLGGLEKAGYVQVRKAFIGRKPNTSYAATDKGKAAFQQHLNALESLLKNNGLTS